MIRSVKLLIVGLLIMGFGVAIYFANGSERADAIADELVEASSVLPENEGKLVMVSGTPALADGDAVVDEDAGLRVERAVYYSRIPYQKVYVLERREVVVDEGEDKLSDVDDVKRTKYYVVKDWVNADHDRDRVITRTGVRYENPPAVKLSAYHASGDLRIAGLRVSSYDVRDYIQTKKGGFTQSELQEACGSYIVRSEIDLRPVTNDSGHGMLSSGDEIGDVHVYFSYETLEGAEPVTVIGRQRGDRLVFEEDDLVTESEHVQPGLVTKEAFLEAASSEDASSRRIGIVALVLGAILVLASLYGG